MQENREAPSSEVEASCPDILERLREELERINRRIEDLEKGKGK